MSKVIVDSRRDLRERAFQALMSLEYDGDTVEACRFAYLHDKEEEEQVELPIFLLNLVNGVMQSKSELDKKIGQYLKSGWTTGKKKDGIKNAYCSDTAADKHSYRRRYLNQHGIKGKKSS